MFIIFNNRCGAGTNNIPVPRMTELGIPVFNTPGANANTVKELVLCGMLLGSRRVVDGINHMKKLGEQGLARERVEKDKAMREIRSEVVNLSIDVAEKIIKKNISNSLNLVNDLILKISNYKINNKT